MHPRRRIVALGVVLALNIALLSANSVGVSAAGGRSFTTLAADFTQELFGVSPTAYGGVAFAPNGDVWVTSSGCVGTQTALVRFSRQNTTVVNGQPVHTATLVPTNSGCGMVNHPDGTIYSNAAAGVVNIDASTGARLRAPFGPAGSSLGIAVDPQTNNLVYVASNYSIVFVNPAFTTSGTLSNVTAGQVIDQIAFDPTGNFLFLSNIYNRRMTILDRTGAFVQSVQLPSEPDGIMFHSAAPHFVLTNNTDGTMTRFDFPSDNFAQAPTQSTFASGGFRGDHTNVGPDGCAYATQVATRYDNGATDGNRSLVRICPGFAPPIGVTRPVIFIHGIGGSELEATQTQLAAFIDSQGVPQLEALVQGDIVWLNALKFLTDPEYFDLLRYNDDGTAMFPSIRTKGTLVTAFPGSYGAVEPFFTSHGYIRGTNFFPFAYDWRNSAQTNVSALDAKITEALQQSGADSVDIVAHSMGTLVSHTYLASGPQRNRINHAILMGGPSLGTPKGSMTVISGVCLVDSLCRVGIGIMPDQMQYIFRTLPGGLDLAVSQHYYEIYDGHDAEHPVPFADERQSPPLTDYATLRAREVAKGATAFALTQAEAFHADDLSWLPAAPGKVSLIAGVGQCTMGQIVENYSLQIGPIKLGDAYDYGEIDGDGTVVRRIASFDDRARAGSANVYYRTKVHGDLAGADVLNDALTLLRDQSIPTGTPGGAMNCSAISVHSPMELQVTDSAGHRMGGSDTRSIRYEIPTASYDRFEDMKVVTLNATDRYTVNLTGTGSGEATIRWRAIDQTGVTQTALFPHVVTTALSRGTVSVDTRANSVGDLTLDLKGDGTNVAIYHPTILTGAAARDRQPPTITILSPSDGQLVGNPVNLNWSVTDDVSGVARVLAVLDDGTAGRQVLAGPAAMVLSAGPHTLDVLSEDRAGNAAGKHLAFRVVNRDLSLAVDGSTGYAEVPHSADLNITGDWTIESWFKDEDPNGFNHDYRQIVMKGDRDTTAEAPYFALIGQNHIIAGVRSGAQDYPISLDLAYLGLDPKAWHHVAVSFDASLNVLNIWLDGQHIDYLIVPTHATAGNTLPLDIGRNGPTTGKYWIGKLDDVRIWSIARAGVDITRDYKTQLSGPQPSLVANWNFDDGSGSVAADSSGNRHTATLNGGATFSTDVHP